MNSPPAFHPHYPRTMALLSALLIAGAIFLARRAPPPLRRPMAFPLRRPPALPLRSCVGFGPPAARWLGPNHLWISRRALAARESGFDGARIVPAVRCGKGVGVKLYAVRPGSVYALLGLQNGDLIERVNGVPLDGADRALEAYSRVRARHTVVVELRRHDAPMSIVYEIGE